jgi:outer membrane protein assembly factor BamB
MRHRCHLALLALATCAPSIAAPVFPGAGEWPCYRGNAALTGHSRLTGAITKPTIVWKQFIGSVDTSLIVEPGSGPSALAVSPGSLPASSPERYDPCWGLAPPLGEIAGQQATIYTSSQTTYAHVFPDMPGLQKLEFESGFAVPTINGQWQPCVGRCFAWKEGKWSQVWQTAPIDMLFSPLPITGDFDGDGKPEVAILPWYELLVLDARTGAIRDRCRFTEGRSYGYFGVYDLNGDGKSEFVVISDFCKHYDVLGYRNGKLCLLWQRNIETDISNPQKILRAYPRPAADVDGDGKLEILVNLYNNTGDGRWHIIVHDGMTGAVKADLVDEHLQGIADLDGDGVAELLTVRTTGAGIPDRGTIMVRSLKGGQPRTLWQCANSAWQTWDPPTPLNVNTAATLGQRDVLCRVIGGVARAVIRQPATGPSGGVSLRLATWGKGRFDLGAGISGSGLQAVAIDDRGRMLVRATTALGGQLRATVTAGKARAICSAQSGNTPGAVIVTRQPGQVPPLVIAQGSDESLVAVRPPMPGKPAAEAWRIPARGQSTNWPSEFRGPVVADLAGDGGRQILYATSAPDGSARFVAANLDLREVWRHDFPEIPGTPPVWNTGGIILWQAGHFTDKRAMDVLVTVRRSMMHSEETLLLSGRDGRQVWRRNREISGRGVGGVPFAVADYDGDGLDDAASFHPSIYYVLKGSTGKDIVAMDTTWPQVPAKPVYWGLPIAGDFEGNGRTSTFFATERASMTGLVRADGSLAWWDALDKSPHWLPAVGNFDGDGKLEVIGVGYEDGVRCYDAATGKVRWRMSLPTEAAGLAVASADINGDGRDEALVACGTTLSCIGKFPASDTGTILWQIALPTTVGPPTIADVRGDGRASILLCGADGYVYCIE